MFRNSKAFWLLTSLLGATLVVADDWPSLGLDGGRSRSSSEILGTPFSLDWSAPLPQGGVSSPSVADGIVVAGSRDGTVYAFQESTGNPLWQDSAGGEILATPLLTRGRAYVPTTDRAIRVYGIQDGTALSTIDSGGTEISSPAADGTFVYTGLGFPNQHLVRYGGSDWRFRLDQITYSSPAVANGRVYIGCNSGRYYCIDPSLPDTSPPAWTFQTAGSVRLSSPLVVGDQIFLVPGGPDNLLYRVHNDPGQWGGNWTSAAAEPPLPPDWVTTRRPVSSPVLAGGYVVFVMRFDQYRDTDGDWINDTVQMSEYLFAVDLNGVAAPWSPLFLGDGIVNSVNDVPQFSVCPTPAVFTSPSGGKLLAVASTLEPRLRILDTDGNLLQLLGLDTPTRASPVVANGRLYVATEQTLYAFTCATNTAPDAPAALSPATGANILVATPTLSWSASVDDDAALTYIVRADLAGDVFLDPDYEFPATASTVMTMPAIAEDTQVTWTVRARDPKGAWSEWAAPQQFWVSNSLAPAPPSNLAAVPGDAQATLSWTASPTQNVVGYWVAVRQGTGPFGPFTPVGNGTAATIAGLTNGLSYTFRLVARDSVGLDSGAVEASATPLPSVALNGVAYPTLAAALAAAAPGDTIQLGTGTLPVPATLTLQEGVSIVGYAPHLTFLDGTGANPVFAVAAGTGAASLRMLTIHGGAVGVDASGREVELRNVILRDMQIGVLSSAGSTVRVINATLVQLSVAGIDVFPSSCEVRNSIFQGNDVGVLAEPGAAPTLTYNNAAGQTTADYVNVTPGTGSTGAAIAFLVDYREPDFSANVDAGHPSDVFASEPSPNGGRINQGAFGNTAWAAKSTATGTSETAGGGGGGGGGCGLVGLDALLLLALLAAARRRRA